MKSNTDAMIRNTLLQLRARIKGDVQQLNDDLEIESGAAGNVAAPRDAAEAEASTMEHELDRSLLQNEAEVLTQIEHALERLNAGTYGTCEACGQAIGSERLKALPYTPVCIACARSREK
jgi:DnaK suppressor protein